MLRTWIWLVLGALLTAAAPVPARAASLTLAGPDGPTLVGQILNVDLWVAPTGLETLPTLRSFDLDVSYDPSHLGFVGVVFDVYLGTPGVQALTSAGAAGGVVDLAAVSLLSSANLDLLQPDSFRLATLRFTALDAATSGLAFLQTVLSDTAGNALDDVDAAGTEVEAVVPEPGSAWLFALGLAALGVRGRHR